MQKGITVWIDVPLEALAQRIAAVGTDSRPLLQYESGDAYTKVGRNQLYFQSNLLIIDLLTYTLLQALLRLNSIWKERGHAYANAHTRVSLEGKLYISDQSH